MSTLISCCVLELRYEWDTAVRMTRKLTHRWKNLSCLDTLPRKEGEGKEGGGAWVKKINNQNCAHNVHNSGAGVNSTGLPFLLSVNSFHLPQWYCPISWHVGGHISEIGMICWDMNNLGNSKFWWSSEKLGFAEISMKYPNVGHSMNQVMHSILILNKVDALCTWVRKLTWAMPWLGYAGQFPSLAIFPAQHIYLIMFHRLTSRTKSRV